MAQFAEMQALWTNWAGPMRSMFGAMPGRYQPLDPLVQEIAVLAMMHNMASSLQNPAALKAALDVEIAARATALAERRD
ncbi:MAG: hypothetical protein IAI49_13855 [Candidatus Eremiobacteraeota bacterium]|nr:hypothetical protein [Candidatus Eremiobacteraeota bacterium]